MLTVSRDIETCNIELLNNFIKFRIIIVKSYLKESNTSIQDSIQNPIQDPIQNSIQDPIQDFIQDSIQDSIQDLIQDSVQEENITLRRNPPRSRQRLIHFQNMTDITIYIFKSMPFSANFQTSRLKELNGLLEKGIFEIIYIDDLFIGARVFENRFINQIKNEEIEKTFEKSRLVI